MIHKLEAQDLTLEPQAVKNGSVLFYISSKLNSPDSCNRAAINSRICLADLSTYCCAVVATSSDIIRL